MLRLPRLADERAHVVERLHGDVADRARGGRGRRGVLLRQRVKLELDEELLQARVIGLAHAQHLQIQRDREIVADCY